MGNLFYGLEYGYFGLVPLVCLGGYLNILYECYTCDTNFFLLRYCRVSIPFFCIHRKKGTRVGHLLSGYSLPMEDPSQSKGDTTSKDIGGTWKVAIKVSYEATKAAFPGGEILAHLDQK